MAAGDTVTGAKATILLMVMEGGEMIRLLTLFQMLNKLQFLVMDMIMEVVMGREEGVVMTITGR